MIVETFKPEHLDILALQPAQQEARITIANKGYGEALARHDSLTAVLDGRVVACAGVVPMWEGRADMWALIAGDIGANGMRKLHFAAKRWLDSAAYRRLEAHCDAQFEQGHRWLNLLGFEYEGPLFKYTPDGRDCLRFARVK